MRRIARIQQRKRQTWLALPASGIEEVGHGQGTKAVDGVTHQVEEKVMRRIQLYDVK